MEIPEPHRPNFFVFVDRSAPDVPADGCASGADWFLHSVASKKLRAFTPLPERFLHAPHPTKCPLGSNPIANRMRRDSTQTDLRIDAGITPLLTSDRAVGHANLQYCLYILGRHYETHMHKRTRYVTPALVMP
jgi:hypothetical protein